MKLAVFQPARGEPSVELYTRAVLAHLDEMGVEVRRFDHGGRLPRADVYWDPTASGGRAPYRRFARLDGPRVVTVHGAAPFSMPSRELYANGWKALLGKLSNRVRLRGWRRYDRNALSIITVSEFAREEIHRHLGLAKDRITAIHHGVDTRRFTPAASAEDTGRFFLHVSVYQPIKNVDRILAAWADARITDGTRLVVVCPRFPKARTRGHVDVEWILERQSFGVLAELYRRALSFVFPSLRESFGMPIVEAMASGCPVLTSRGSACEEVAGDAALLVDPRSTREVRDAMTRLASDPDLRFDLRCRGLERCRAFSWQAAAEAHLRVFEEAQRSAP